jgi:DnaJ-domain-containing protein 1
MDGEVKQGSFQGRRLKDLDLASLLSLLREVSVDPDSVGLVEAYLDRTHPDWRESAEPGEGAAGNSAPSSSAMTADEAYRILGLNAGASNDDIKAAYRRLMGQLHPDHGGSDYLAAKVNQAKDFLLKH